MTLSIRFVLVGLLASSQDMFANANRDDGVARFIIQKGHGVQEHLDLSVTSDIQKADKCDQSSIFKAIAGEDKKIDESEWTALFTEMDTDKGGTISKEEFSGHFKVGKDIDCTPDDVEFFFDKFDIDNNDAIDKDEWETAWKMLLTKDKSGNNDGKIDEEEWISTFKATKATDSASETEKAEGTCDSMSIFKVIAGDDKKIEKKEWTSWFTEMEADTAGFVTKADMIAYLKKKEMDCDEDAIKFFFAKFDADKDGPGSGKIDEKEWKKGWETMTEADKAGNNDGKIEEDEWKAAFGDSEAKEAKGAVKSGAMRFPFSLSAVCILFACLRIQVV